MNQQLIYEDKGIEKQVIEESLNISGSKGSDFYLGLISQILNRVDKIEKHNLLMQIMKID